MKREWKSWTPEEDALLREIWAQPGSLKLSANKFPNRTIHAIRFRGHCELGLPRRAKLKTSTYSWVQEVIDVEFKKGFVGTVYQMAEITPASHQRIRTTIRNGQGTKYYIAGWEKRTNGCDWTPRWALGTEQDIPKPEPKSKAEISKRFRANKKRREGQHNPFAILMNQVLNAEPPKVQARPERGRYESRVYQQSMSLRDFEEVV
jgi:hypothetical protein